jgi:hypothetical protein
LNFFKKESLKNSLKTSGKVKKSQKNKKHFFKTYLEKINQKIFKEVVEPHHMIRLQIQFRLQQIFSEFRCGSGSTTFMTSKNNKKRASKHKKLPENKRKSHQYIKISNKGTKNSSL